ncbi:hypothetical protein DQ04_01641090 [Trypanosoma grayi]|uniref:hypothetical protein n=1 Tax=Trypanosoma grayi TaxID=71804 RepID=UPI0004F46748|nr:hypothetical protein DQ04_01641090 [Trypanosoma grayi]KEG12530.1 hypothetical protein DQ04_01641090 [Trypanosoma grayi]
MYRATCTVRRAAPRFFFKGRRNTAEYYVGRGGAEGHPDMVADCISGSRADPEWMWLKLLCFVCMTSTVGTWMWQTYFWEQAKFFKDEPWSPFRN